MCVISLGTFDGLHLGHRKLLDRVRELASTECLKSVIITYKDHPAFILNQRALPKLLCPSEVKEQELKRLGIDQVEMLDFSQDLAETSALDFLQNVLIPRWRPKIIVVGHDSHFGKNREGDRSFLERFASRFNFRVEYVEPQLFEGKPISSSMIRDFLSRGQIEEANHLLGRSYRLSGKVGKGLARGREFGFPTANLILSNPHQLIPAEGIYLSKAHLEQASFFSLTNIGKSPTVKHTGIVEIETFLIDFTGDIYDDNMQVELLHYLREERMFANTDDLVAAMNRDLERAIALVAELQA
ncbi:MAG: bifunctional riboflavin kinase/FAD synthetase [Candidatus Cloacimonetes bacterium]|jgi:riboflavin kinase/FMN adenylyltransferase|nr:bifunctional riboflavin kinase/FAD synthetase [Candidatus Cloacimonadota bacterium]MDD2505960.1 bifunctional riboflavin kinase/FAD synthetase [Candidatus Cloacimonadota bacterium]MDD4146947.1 bifunctional riboflavin kinase/FAD synthetase [Candidatus Cloacimonadota bacterium]MDD4559500.1 bifunctional riboflavin kinase/FAD synthetase [Candidatus Cloacimonadota bacterium]